jgi:biotin transport system substrate-specific component
MLTSVVVRSRAGEATRSLAFATLGAVSLALLAQPALQVPFTPVPITLQVLVVLVLGGLLGPYVAALAVAEYLLLGAAGLPVFSSGLNLAGLVALRPVTIGYLLAFAPAAAAYGAIYAAFARRGYAVRLLGAALAGVAGIAVIYLGGWAWIASALGQGWHLAFLWAIAPFIVVDLLKAAVAAGLVAWQRK